MTARPPVSEKCGHCTGESLRTVNRTEFWDAGCHANSISIKRNTASLLVLDFLLHFCARVYSRNPEKPGDFSLTFVFLSSAQNRKTVDR